MMKLIDTIDLMISDDYKERFKAEYYQTKIRYDKLHKMIIKYEAQQLDFEPTTDIEILKQQAQYMGMYLHTLEVRAEVEKINLDWKPKEKVEIKFGQSRGYFDDMDNLINKFNEDLEEMLNDFTEKRES